MKRENPVWIPPEWHYAEVATETQVPLGTAQARVHRARQFVRLVMNENILRGVNVAEIEGIKARNKRVVATIEGLLARGVEEGVFRDGIDPLFLHLTMSALSFYCVSNRYTIAAGFGVDLAKKAVKLRRREDIVATVLASVRA